MPKGSRINSEYKYRGEVFKYVVAHYGHGKLWAAPGQLESDPSITVQTGPFPTKREAHEEFKKKGKKNHR